MTSKGKNNQVQGKDAFCRMNFLFQASMLMAGKNDALSSYYGNLCRTIGKKSVLRLQPNLKRKLCKRCGTALKPGITAELSATGGKREAFKMKCSKCKFEKNYIVDPKYSFWLENPKAIVKDPTKQKKKKKEEPRQSEAKPESMEVSDEAEAKVD